MPLQHSYDGVTIIFTVTMMIGGDGDDAGGADDDDDVENVKSCTNMSRVFYD